MAYVKLEEDLRKRIKVRRMVLLAVSLVFFAVFVTCSLGRELSAVVEEVDLGFIKHKTIVYNENYTWGILIGVIVFIPALISLIADHIFCKVDTIAVGAHFVTFYRGELHTNLYVNGELRDSITFFGHYLETTLPDGVRVTVALGKWSAHVTFSNGKSPIDI